MASLGDFDLCDRCGRSDVIVERVDENGETVCVDCDAEITARPPMPRRSRPPMTAFEACENIASMRAETAPAAMRQLIQTALGPTGNLSEEARAIYAAALN
jgi:recombinational DNA repair protein (RecF pathway)